MLKKEYELRNLMDTFEGKMKKMIHRCQQYSVIEFFMEQDSIKQDIVNMKKQITSMSVYMPEYNLKNVDEIDKVKASIRTTLQEKL